ncbi:MAG: hypothetical protein SFX73_13825 [Kofleriaceae bacterium]|nr:hypothetical protein [Kofleriaceae bacterium]
MPRVRCLAVRWISEDPFPGLVECHLVDANGTVHVLVDKTAVLDDTDRLRPGAAYPMELQLDCRVVAETADAIEIELAHGVIDGLGRAVFFIKRGHLIG